MKGDHVRLLVDQNWIRVIWLIYELTRRCHSRQLEAQKTFQDCYYSDHDDESTITWLGYQIFSKKKGCDGHKTCRVLPAFSNWVIVLLEDWKWTEKSFFERPVTSVVRDLWPTNWFNWYSKLETPAGRFVFSKVGREKPSGRNSTTCDSYRFSGAWSGDSGFGDFRSERPDRTGRSIIDGPAVTSQ